VANYATVMSVQGRQCLLIELKLCIVITCPIGVKTGGGAVRKLGRQRGTRYQHHSVTVNSLPCHFVASSSPSSSSSSSSTGRSGLAVDCSAWGPGIESRCGQLCLSHNHC